MKRSKTAYPNAGKYEPALELLETIPAVQRPGRVRLLFPNLGQIFPCFQLRTSRQMGWVVSGEIAESFPRKRHLHEGNQELKACWCQCCVGGYTFQISSAGLNFCNQPRRNQKGIDRCFGGEFALLLSNLNEWRGILRACMRQAKNPKRDA